MSSNRMGSGHVRQADDARHAPYGSTVCFSPHPPSARSPPRRSRGALSAARRSLHPKPLRGEGEGTPEGLGALGPQPPKLPPLPLRLLSQSAGALVQGAPPLRCGVRREGARDGGSNAR